MKRTFFTTIFLILLLAGGAGAYFVARGSKSRDWKTYSVTRGDLEVTISQTSKLESADNYQIRSELEGKNVLTWLIESGTYVKKGDLLATFDTLSIENQVFERTKFAHWSRSSAQQSKASSKAAKLRVEEYSEGLFPAQLKQQKKDLALLESGLKTAQNMLNHTEQMAARGYVSQLQVEEKEFGVTRAELNVEVAKAQIEVLKKHTRAEELVRLEGNWKAQHEDYLAAEERALADEALRDRFKRELKNCEVRAERDGIVIRPQRREWEQNPIEEGAEVWKTQPILLMPDLKKMQAKIGVHESLISKIKLGLDAKVTLLDQTMQGEVSEVAAVSRPAGWWNGYNVEYDVFVRLPPTDELRPGTSAEIEVVLSRNEDVLLIPVGAVLDLESGTTCWVDHGEGAPERRSVTLGDTNGLFVVVHEGLEKDEKVVIDPADYIEQAKSSLLLTIDGKRDPSEDRGPSE